MALGQPPIFTPNGTRGPSPRPALPLPQGRFPQRRPPTPGAPTSPPNGASASENRAKKFWAMSKGVLGHPMTPVYLGLAADAAFLLTGSFTHNNMAADLVEAGGVFVAVGGVAQGVKGILTPPVSMKKTLICFGGAALALVAMAKLPPRLLPKDDSFVKTTQWLSGHVAGPQIPVGEKFRVGDTVLVISKSVLVYGDPNLSQGSSKLLDAGTKFCVKQTAVPGNRTPTQELSTVKDGKPVTYWTFWENNDNNKSVVVVPYGDACRDVDAAAAAQKAAPVNTAPTGGPIRTVPPAGKGPLLGPTAKGKPLKI